MAHQVGFHYTDLAEIRRVFLEVGTECIDYVIMVERKLAVGR